MSFFKTKCCSSAISLLFVFLALISGSPLLAQPGNALSFDGANDYVDAGDNGTLDFGTGDFTVELWILKQPGADFGGVNKWNTGAAPGTNEWAINLNAGFGGKALFGIESGNTTYQVLGLNNLTNGQWHHIAGVREGAAIKMYVDGVLEGTVSTGTAVPVNNAGRTLMLGRLFSGNYSNHTLDEVRIWNVARTLSEIQSARYYSVSPSTTGLKAYYKFQQGTGGGNNAGLTTLPDLTGSGNTGTLHGFALSGTTSNWITSSAPINAFVLPLRSISLRAMRTTKAVQVDWNVIGAVDMLYYEVERATAASSEYRILKRIASASDGDRNYSWKDDAPLSGAGFYRIRAADANGHVQYSPVVNALADKETQELSVYPNPFKGNTVNLRLSGASGIYQLVWYNVAGGVSEKLTLHHGGGNWSYMLSTTNLVTTGVYFLEISTSGGTVGKISIIKQ